MDGWMDGFGKYPWSPYVPGIVLGSEARTVNKVLAHMGLVVHREP